MKIVLTILSLLVSSACVQKTPLTLEEKIKVIRSKESIKNALNTYIDLIYDVDCSQIDQMLTDIFESDQEVRNTGELFEETDHTNQIEVLSIIEKCGFPSVENLSSYKSKMAIPLVLQHTTTGLLEYYYPELLDAVENGLIDKSFFALIQDRILMFHGYAQIYGSQITNGQLYKIEDPKNVNQRRNLMGLGQIEEYLDRFGLNFEEEISNQKNRSTL